MSNFEPFRSDSDSTEPQPIHPRENSIPPLQDPILNGHLLSRPIDSSEATLIKTVIAAVSQGYQKQIKEQRRQYRTEIGIRDRQIQSLEAQLAIIGARDRTLEDQSASIRLLGHIPTTYETVKSKSGQFNRSMNAFQQFLLFVIIGVAVLGLISLTLPSATLWPVVRTILSPIIRIIFSAVLVSIVVVFVWEFAQS